MGEIGETGGTKDRWPEASLGCFPPADQPESWGKILSLSLICKMREDAATPCGGCKPWSRVSTPEVIAVTTTLKGHSPAAPRPLWTPEQGLDRTVLGIGLGPLPRNLDITALDGELWGSWPPHTRAHRHTRAAPAGPAPAALSRPGLQAASPTRHTIPHCRASAPGGPSARAPLLSFLPHELFRFENSVQTGETLVASAGDNGPPMQEACDGEQGAGRGTGQHPHKVGSQARGLGGQRMGSPARGGRAEEDPGGTSPGQEAEGSRPDQRRAPEVGSTNPMVHGAGRGGTGTLT